MFEKIPMAEKELIYMGLKKLISTNSGQGFYNADQGHPCYALGSRGKGKPLDESDLPEKNILFKMLKELSDDFKKDGHTNYKWWYDFSTWENFCKFAYDNYLRSVGEKSGV
jgi:hypothetical protein